MIATDHSLAHEVVGDAGVLISPGNPVEVSHQLRFPPCIPAEVRADRAKQFSWKAFGETYETELLRVAAQSGHEREVVRFGCSE